MPPLSYMMSYFVVFYRKMMVVLLCPIYINQQSQALGEAIGQDQAYMSRVENKIITDVTAETLARIARVLEVPMEHLVTLDAAETGEAQLKRKSSRRKPAARTGTKASPPKQAHTPAKAAKG